MVKVLVISSIFLVLNMLYEESVRYDRGPALFRIHIIKSEP